MNRTALALVLAFFVAPAYAGFMAQEVDEGIYFVSYERGRWTSSTVLDTARKARRKIDKASHRFCLEEGYSYLRFPTLGQISRDESLKSVWEIAVGDEAADSFEVSGGDHGLVSKAHKVHRLLLLSTEEMEGFEACVQR
jgi:hypothetical protein